MIPALPADAAAMVAVSWRMLGEAETASGINRLDGATRAKVLAALAALIILGFAMVALAWMGARYTRRYMGAKPAGPSGATRTDEWAQRPKEDNSIN